MSTFGERFNFARRLISLQAILLSALMIAWLTGSAGCGLAKPAGEKNDFKTPFQTESQYIVETIVADLVEQIAFAATGRVPDPQKLRVASRERSEPTVDTPSYTLEIEAGPERKPLSVELKINGSIWSPKVYEALAVELAKSFSLTGSLPSKPDNSTLLTRLTDGKAATIEQENLRLSAALEKDFRNPGLHEEAALLLGAFVFRDCAGRFSDIRAPLCRLSAHLTMAHLFRGGGAPGTNGQMAELILLTSMHNQSEVLKKLETLDAKDELMKPLLRAVRYRVTGDYRDAARIKGAAPLERLEWFQALCDFGDNAPGAWSKITEEEQQRVDFIRRVGQSRYSVELGHYVLRLGGPLELGEVGAIAALSRGRQLQASDLIKVLNELPERCFSLAAGGKPSVRVIGWGQWAYFLQRHLCSFIQTSFDFAQHKWGDHDTAKEFAAECEKQFGQLRLYPFVRRFTSLEAQAYHQAVDDALKVAQTTPHLVPCTAWCYLSYPVQFAPLYEADPTHQIGNWFSRSPLPGTAYDLEGRLDPPILPHGAEAIARVEKLREIAPYHGQLIFYLVREKYHDRPNYEQILNLCRPVLPYTIVALWGVAHTVENQPEEYEKILLPAVDLNPICGYGLANNAARHHQRDKAAQYYDQACHADTDEVRIASYAEWRVNYWLEKGQIDRARRIADQAGETYSYRGLEAKAAFLEATTNYDGAFQYFAKIEERYEDSMPLLEFCLRHKGRRENSRYDAEVEKRLKKIFPEGMKKVSLSEFQGQPADGVQIRQENLLLKAAGMKLGDVIVALHGVRVHSLQQYAYVRDFNSSNELDLIVWQGDAYREIKASPPKRRFGVDFGDYRPNR